MVATRPRLAIVGAGPIGLDAALAATERGWPFTIYEAGGGPGASVRAWGHVRMFTPWSMNVSPRMRARLGAAGTAVPSGEECPRGHDLAERLLGPVADLAELRASLEVETRVVGIGRHGLLKHEEIATPARAERPFRLLLSGPGGRQRVAQADVVIDCSGTYGHANSTGDAGIPAVGEQQLETRIRRTVPHVAAEEQHWAGRRTLLVGGGHSAQTAAADLAALGRRVPGTEVVWAVRAMEPTWGAVADDPLPERAALVEQTQRLAGGDDPSVRLVTGAVVESLAERDGRLAVTLRNGSSEAVVVDQVLSLTGYVGDAELYRQLQVHECYATAAPINLSAALLGAAAGDCLGQESHGVDVLRNPEPNFFILGSKSYGRNSQFLLGVGWDQVDEVFGALDAEVGQGPG
ncbi:MAG: FAD-dependent oxidoreductase [Actinobacteria bacterium]|nr:FAD-dependent oxidoreductase [Actinomycetota bacterium]